MAITKTEIFIASRFEEFAELRELLRERINSFSVFPLQAIDLNDNAAGPRPPLGKCVSAVKRAEIMILLVGETYGGCPPNEERSFTHLEYLAATDESSSTVVLPYFIGASYADKLATFSRDPKLAGWQQVILDNHTPAFFDGADSPRELCQIIFESALATLYEARNAEIQRQMDMIDSSGEQDYEHDSDVDEPKQESTHLSFEELERLDRTTRGKEDLYFDNEIENISDVTELLKRPAETAAFEQQVEAFKAIDLGDRFTAIKHFKRALEHRPLDLPASYWLARLLISSGRNKDSRDAIRYALMACRMASHDHRPVMVSASFMVAARAAAKLNEFDEAMEYARKAAETTPWLAAANLELACQFANRGDLDQAFKIVRQAFMIHPNSILKLNNEPAFLKHRRAYREFKERLRDELVKGAQKLFQAERGFVEKFVDESERQSVLAEIDISAAKISSRPLLNVVKEGRKSARSYLQVLQDRAETIWSRGPRDMRIRPVLYDRDNLNSVANKALAIGIVLCVVVMVLLAKKMLMISFMVSPLPLAALYTWQTNRSKTRVLNNDLSDIESIYFKELTDLAHCIVDYESNALQLPLFAVGGNLKSAKEGDVVRVDLRRQSEQLAQCHIDDAVLPAHLANESQYSVDTSGVRFRNYRVVNIRGGIKSLSRSAVYFPSYRGSFSSKTDNWNDSDNDDELLDYENE